MNAAEIEDASPHINDNVEIGLMGARYRIDQEIKRETKIKNKERITSTLAV